MHITYDFTLFLSSKRVKNKNKSTEKRREEGLLREPKRVYVPPVPFPYRRVVKQLDNHFNKFIEKLSRIEMKIPFLEEME